MIDNKKMFWDWFSKKSNQITDALNIDDSDETKKLLNELLKNLHAYCQNLFFEVGNDANNKIKELIITAEGNSEFFNTAKELVESAPNLKNWRIIALKQPQGVDFQMNFEGMKFLPKEMWFLPLENKNKSDSIGIRVCFKDFIRYSENNWRDSALKKLIETIIGEESFNTDIQYIDFGQLPNNPANEGYLELSELSDYIKWKKKQIGRQA